MNESHLLEARRKAERAVSDMPDGDLKIKAFEIILSQLLASASSEPGAAKGPPRSLPPSKVPVAKVVSGHAANSKCGRILSLRDEGFFKTQRTIVEVRDKLRAHGWVYELSSLSGPLQLLVQKQLLRRAMVTDGKKKTFKYVNP